MIEVPLKAGDDVTLAIDRMANGGNGVARHESGIVVFVPLSAPGDTLRARVTLVKKNFAEAEILEVLSAGPSRREAPCPVYGACGGCNWQHIDYSEQLKQKQAIVGHGLGKLEPEAEILPIIAGDEWRYRHRVQVHLSGGELGFLKRKSHDLVSISDCLITSEQITSHFDDLRKKTKAGDKPARFEAGVRESGEFYSLDLGKEEYSFFQANLPLNDVLVKTALDFVAQEPCARLLDLYCGDGNFTFAAADRFPKCEVTGIESNAAAVRRAMERLRKEPRGDRLRFVQQDVARHLESLPADHETAVLVDPPRIGCDPRVLRQLERFPPKSLVYVSCNLTTFLRDAGELMKAGFSLRTVQPLDMFPQTDHIELVAYLCYK